MIGKEITLLVLRAQAGDRPAYGELVQSFEPMVYALAMLRLRNPSEAQELTQEVFVHALRKLEQLKEPAAFPGWLRQITVRMASNRLSRRGPLRSGEDDTLANQPGVAVSPLDELIRAERRAELYQGLAQLKASDRQTLVDFYLRGQSLRQMSQELEAPIGTIKRRLHVARRRLRRELERDPRRPRGGKMSPHAPYAELALA
jgi:RNA polymerase sigma-70 factor (ECF subfamily)